MDDYLKHFREMISLRGLTDHTIVSYSTYIRAYLDIFPISCTRSGRCFLGVLHILSAGSKEKNLSDRTINHCISQLHFLPLSFTNRDPTQACLITLTPMSLMYSQGKSSFPPCPASSPIPCAHSCIPPACVSVKCAFCSMRIFLKNSASSICNVNFLILYGLPSRLVSLDQGHIVLVSPYSGLR